jgi:hypothetical protein
MGQFTPNMDPVVDGIQELSDPIHRRQLFTPGRFANLDDLDVQLCDSRAD